MGFTRKFNVGLTLETDFAEFESFIKAYHPYIHSVYFSVPVNRLFHTRTRVACMFWIPGKTRMFWKMLRLIKSYGIELELLFNTLRLNDQLIKKAADVLVKQGIDVDSVCFLSSYYDAVCRYFPNKTYILSFNNGYQHRSQVEQALDTYTVDAVVLGSAFIRNNAMFSYLKERGIRTYLLLNNACSFNCGTCNNVQTVCERAFQENLKKFSVEYLYALQSIFPHELRDGTIRSDLISCFKISNRSSDLKFLQGALDSYISCKVDDYVYTDRNHFAFWGRAGFFWKHFQTMDLDKIWECKEQIFKKDLSMYRSQNSDLK